MSADLILYNIGELFCPIDNNEPLRGQAMNTAKIMHNAYIAIKAGKIQAIGEGEVPESLISNETQKRDLSGLTVTPGLIDSHTHLVHGGSRENEFSMKLNGVSYLDILAAGGGILSTVNATKTSTFDELYTKAKKA